VDVLLKITNTGSVLHFKINLRFYLALHQKGRFVADPRVVFCAVELDNKLTVRMRSGEQIVWNGFGRNYLGRPPSAAAQLGPYLVIVLGEESITAVKAGKTVSRHFYFICVQATYVEHARTHFAHPHQSFR